MGLATAVLGSLHFGAWYLGRAKTWGSESRQDFEFNDSEENEGEEERAFQGEDASCVYVTERGA